MGVNRSESEQPKPIPDEKEEVKQRQHNGGQNQSQVHHQHPQDEPKVTDHQQSYTNPNNSANPNQGAKPVEALSVATLVADMGAVLDEHDVDSSSSKIKEIFEEILKSKSKPGSVTIIPAVRTGNFTCVTVWDKLMVGTRAIIAMHTYVIEASMPPLDPFVEQYMGQAIEIPLTPAQAVDRNFRTVVGEEVKAASNFNNPELIAAGYQVIYREKPIDAQSLYQLLNTGLTAIRNSLFRFKDNSKNLSFTLDGLTAAANLRVNSRVSLEANHIGINALPLRSDIVTELSVHDQNVKNPIKSNTGTSVSRAAAYVDLIWLPPTAQQQYAFQQTGYLPHYIPRLIITELSTQLSVDPVNALLLAIANVSTLAHNRAYAVQWRDNFGRTGSHMADPGAIGYQIPALTQERAPGLIAIESDQTLMSLMSKVMQDAMVYTLDIDQAGPNSWLTGIFAGATKQDAPQNALLCRAANALTNGRFKPLYMAKLAAMGITDEKTAYGRPILRDIGDVVHSGYYTRVNENTGEQEKHDLRELDLLAILNISKGNPQYIDDYLSTLQTTNEHPNIRLDRRLRLFRKLVSDIRVKGYSTRFDFDKFFVNSLIEAVQGSNLRIGASNQLLNQGGPSYTQTIQDWGNQVVTGSMNAYAQNTQAYNSNFGNNSGNFWSTGW